MVVSKHREFELEGVTLGKALCFRIFVVVLVFTKSGSWFILGNINKCSILEI